MTLLLLCLLGLDLQFKNGPVTVGAQVRLGDVLSSASMKQLQAEGVPNLTLVAAPPVNRSRAVQASHVLNTLRNRASLADVSFRGATAVTVKRRAQPFSQDALESSIEEWVQYQSPATGELRLERVFAPQIKGVPVGEVTYDIKARGRTPSGLPVGRQSLSVDILINGKRFKTLAVQVETSLETMVAVALVDLTRGAPMHDDHVEWRPMRLSRINAPLVEPHQLQGMRVKTHVRAGDILDQRKLEPVPLVERNQMVHVIARTGGLEVRMKALALQPGGRGQVIRLKNVESNQILTGRVVDFQEVVLDIL